MEKGKIISLKVSKKKNTIFGYIRVKGKNFDVHSNDFDLSLEMNNQDCDVSIVNGNKIVSVLFNEKEIMKNPKKNLNISKSKEKKSTAKDIKENKIDNEKKTKITFAIAPYNFVPLNEKVVTLNKPANFDEYTGNTGYINLEIETKTPIYVRGEGSDFYQQAGKYRIPGSSIRGMIRNLVEIVSWSKFGFINDDYLYYRTFADKAHSVRDEYKKNMTPEDEEGYGQYIMKSGLLYKRGLNYFIIPAERSFEKIKKPDSKKIIEGMGKIYKNSSFYKIDDNHFIVVPGKKFKEEWSKRNDWQIFANPNDKESAIKVPRNDIISYQNDKNRNGVDILKKARRNEVPCFYVNWTDKKGNNRISFGHTPLFRLSYFKSIGEHIKQQSFDEKKFDFAESMFGKETKFATRLFFEDLILNSLTNSREEKISKILASPNPTSFQLYLEQKGIQFLENLKHYNDDVQIRGNKLYWHKKNSEWVEKSITLNKDAFEKYLKRNSIDFNIFLNSIVRDEKGKIELNLLKLSKIGYSEIMIMIKKEIEKLEKEKGREIETQHTVIKPINKGAKFYDKIRFENLTDIELGALLFALDLPDGCYHKIGMGKPLGLGSIKITPRLFLSNRKDRYKNLFAEWNGLKEYAEKIKNFKSKFEEFILKEIDSSKKSLWNLDRMKELKKMLTFNHHIPNDKLSYMKMEEFKKRGILPHPTEVKGHA